MRISATELENFRYYLDESEQPLWVFLERLRNNERNDKMLVGSALHFLLEKSEGELEDAVVYYWMEGDREKFDLYPPLLPGGDALSFQVTLDCDLHIPRLQEVKTERTYSIDGMDVTVVAKTDAIEGRRIWDHKFTENPDVENYLDSRQWPTYLTLFEADSFTYNVFRYKEKKGIYVVNGLEQITFHRYPEMDQQVERWVGEYADFLKRHMPERISEGDERKLRF